MCMCVCLCVLVVAFNVSFCVFHNQLSTSFQVYVVQYKTACYWCLVYGLESYLSEFSVIFQCSPSLRIAIPAAMYTWISDFRPFCYISIWNERGKIRIWEKTWIKTGESVELFNFIFVSFRYRSIYAFFHHAAYLACVL